MTYAFSVRAMRQAHKPTRSHLSCDPRGLTPDLGPGFTLSRMNTSHRDFVTIGRLAADAGVGIDTVRHYEREGLLPAPARSESGYRPYDAASATRLRFIRRARDLGFSLDDVRDLLALVADGRHGTQGMRQRAETRLADIERRIAELRRVQRGLKRLIDACPGHGPLGACPILAALGDKESP